MIVNVDSKIIETLDKNKDALSSLMHNEERTGQLLSDAMVLKNAIEELSQILKNQRSLTDEH